MYIFFLNQLFDSCACVWACVCTKLVQNGLILVLQIRAVIGLREAVMILLKKTQLSHLKTFKASCFRSCIF